MLLIPCPWCGDRAETEFRYGGSADIVYPADPEQVDDRNWLRVVYVRPNTRGPFKERWCHVYGCRRWFTIVRDTLTHEIVEP